MDGLHPSLSPDRRETPQERYAADAIEAGRMSRVFDEFAAFLADLSNVDPDLSALRDMRVVARWFDDAPDAVKEVMLAGIRRCRIAHSYQTIFDQDPITIMGTRLQAEVSRKPRGKGECQ